jgi:hypothetical protein
MHAAKGLNHGPWSIRTPENHQCHARVQSNNLQILWLLANPFVVHGIGESAIKAISTVFFMDAAGSNQV